MRKPRCLSIAATLSARGEDGLSPQMRAHVDECLACRAELVGHRSLERELSGLRSVELRAPQDLYAQVMAEVGPWAVPDPSSGGLRVRIAAAAVATAATATAAAGTAVILLRARQRAA